MRQYARKIKIICPVLSVVINAVQRLCKFGSPVGWADFLPMLVNLPNPNYD
jgi:hypothetical protein